MLNAMRRLPCSTGAPRAWTRSMFSTDTMDMNQTRLLSSLAKMSSRNTYGRPSLARANSAGISSTVSKQMKATEAIPLAPEPTRYHPSSGPGTADIYSFFHANTCTWPVQYVIVDPATRDAVLIDTALDYDAASGALSTKAADVLLDFVNSHSLNVVRILETHAHADHLTASQYLKSKLPGHPPICIGSRITQVQSNFAPFYGFDKSILAETFDIFLQDEESFPVGDLSCKVIHLPGHTPDHIGYIIGTAVFTGDSIFMPDVGSARVDFPGGNASQLYASMQRLLSLPGDYMLFVGHDYPDGREKADMSTVAEQRKLNKHVKVGTSEDTFIKFRKERDEGLGAPRLLHPSIQVNVRAGKLPPPDKDGHIHMKIPIRSPSHFK